MFEDLCFPSASASSGYHFRTRCFSTALICAGITSSGRVDGVMARRWRHGGRARVSRHRRDAERGDRATRNAGLARRARRRRALRRGLRRAERIEAARGVAADDGVSREGGRRAVALPDARRAARFFPARKTICGIYNVRRAKNISALRRRRIHQRTVR